MADRPTFETPLRSVFDKGTVEALAKLNLETVGDLIYHLPRRYFDFQQLSNLREAVIGEHLTVVARVVKSEPAVTRTRKHILKVEITDGDNAMKLTFFSGGSPRAVHGWAAMLRPGTRAMFSGEVKQFQGKPTLNNPQFHAVDDSDESGGVVIKGRSSRILPVYPATGKLPSWKIDKAIATVLPMVTDDEVSEMLPGWLLQQHRWPRAAAALRLMHDPPSLEAVGEALQRMKFEEAYVLQTALARRRLAAREVLSTPRTQAAGGLLAAFDALLPFELTAGQKQVSAEIADDLAQPFPMHRLLQGEVGSGKTVVALRAMLTVVDSGGQAALLAPTEVLAQQHHRSITRMLGSLGQAGQLALAGPEVDGVAATKVTLLTGSLTTKAKRQALLDIASGQAGIVVGTHALLQDSVDFADLGLVVVDEQHRFGVEQRDALRAKANRTPHLLVMTATPIPRTVAMTIFGDLETSTLREIPAGRQPITSYAVPGGKPGWIERVWQIACDQVAEGRQVFVVCPAIDPPAAGSPQSAASEDRDGQVSMDLGADDAKPMASVIETFAELCERFPDLRLAMLHGRMSADEKDQVMTDFAAGLYDVLVATTVIEVGVDVPNASVMIVVDASRFGVSQLHQLRGRVGRGAHPGFCFFLSGAVREQVGGVLEAVAATSDGFELARIDLANRREGDVLGAAQSGGLSSLRLLRVTEDEDLIVEARALAVDLVADDPELSRHPLLAAAINRLLNPEREVFLERS